MEEEKSGWPLAIIFFFAVVFMTNGILVYLAVSGFDGLVEDNYYEKGLRYNEVIRQEKRLAWRITLSSPDDLKPGTANKVKVVIFDKTGEPIGGAKVNLAVRRPATSRYDVEYELVPSGCAYHGTVNVPLPGHWDILVRAEKGADRMEKTFRMRTKDGSSAKI